MKKLVHQLYNRIGFEPKATDSHLDTLLRSNVVSWACSLGIKECSENVKNNYRRWMDETEPDSEGSNP